MRTPPTPAPSPENLGKNHLRYTDVDKQIEQQIREQYYGDRMRLIKTLQAQGVTFEKFRQKIRDR
jgi:hypothetical protein